MPKYFRFALALVFLLLLSTSASAKIGTADIFSSTSPGDHKLALGLRYHQAADSVAHRALSDEDLSWVLAYEYHEEIAFWQIALGYASGSNTDADARVLTPEVNLIFKDGIYRLGLGALINRVSASNSQWTDLHWQVILGVSIPVASRISVDLYGHYLFHKWDEISKTSDNAAEASLLLAFQF